MHGKPPWASTLDNALLLDRGPIGSSRARLLPGGLHGKPPWASTLDNALLLDRGPIGSTCCVFCSVRTPDSPPFGQTRLLRSLQTVALGGGWQCKPHDESLAKVGFDGDPVLGRAWACVFFTEAKKSPRKPGAKNTAYDQILMIPRNSRMELTKIIARMMGATNFMMTT